MGGSGGNSALRRFAGLLGLIAGGLLVANCSGNVAGRVDPRYGVASSPRVVPLGERAPKGGGVYRVGKPYTVAGRTYVPEVDNHFDKVGLASWYGDDFHGRYTANGEIFDENSISAASPTLPLPSYARVTNLANHRSIVVRVNDRGPYVGSRLIDVSVKTAKLLGFYDKGVARVRVQYVGRAPLQGSSDRKLAETLRDNTPMAGMKVASAEPFEGTFFDPHPMAQLPRHRAPTPPDRPYAAGASAPPSPEAERVARAPYVVPSRAPTVELAAATRPELPVSQVSAYAPVRYDGHNGFMSGRGLY
jgi:peptidoglycan lytic transglycosylase